jgi:hypothetical protein
LNEGKISQRVQYMIEVAWGRTNTKTTRFYKRKMYMVEGEKEIEDMKVVAAKRFDMGILVVQNAQWINLDRVFESIAVKIRNQSSSTKQNTA